nr:MAG TPA_asm: hypothetical protein [Caudoviricetes sp.]
MPYSFSVPYIIIIPHINKNVNTFVVIYLHSLTINIYI